LVVGVDLMANANPGARKSIARRHRKIGDEYRDGASDLPIEIRNSASSVAPNGSGTHQPSSQHGFESRPTQQPFSRRAKPG
jgi:hypothetical protein